MPLSITSWLLLTLAAVFSLQQLFPALDSLALYHVASGGFQPVQLLTYAFLHGSVLHLSVNMLGLWSLGREMERLWGRGRYLVFLLVCAVAGGAAQLLATDLQLSIPEPALGASASLMGLVVAFAAAYPRRQMMLLVPPVLMSARTLALVCVAITLLLGLTGWGPPIAHWAHGGGMLAAWMLLRSPRWRANRDSRDRRDHEDGPDPGSQGGHGPGAGTSRTLDKRAGGTREKALRDRLPRPLVGWQEGKARLPSVRQMAPPARLDRQLHGDAPSGPHQPILRPRSPSPIRRENAALAYGDASSRKPSPDGPTHPLRSSP